MAVVFAVQDGRDVLRPPLVGVFVFLAFRATAEGERLQGWLAQQAVRGKRIGHVAQYRVVDAVTNEADGVIAEQFAHESRCPALGQVGTAEITAGDDEVIQITMGGIVRQQAVQIDEAVPTFLRNGQHRGLTTSDFGAPCGNDFLKQPVEVRGHESHPFVAVTAERQQCCLCGRRIRPVEVRGENLRQSLTHLLSLSDDCAFQ